MRFEFYGHDPRTTASAPTLSDSSSSDFYVAGSNTVSTTLDDDLVPTSALGPQRNYIHTNVTYTRDAAKRVTSRAVTFLPGASGGLGGFPLVAPTADYEYYPNGYLKRVTNVDGDHVFTYDSRGLLATQVIAGEGTYTYTHDPVGRLATVTFPDGHVRRQVYEAHADRSVCDDVAAHRDVARDETGSHCEGVARAPGSRSHGHARASATADVQRRMKQWRRVMARRLVFAGTSSSGPQA